MKQLPKRRLVTKHNIQIQKMIQRRIHFNEGKSVDTPLNSDEFRFEGNYGCLVDDIDREEHHQQNANLWNVKDQDLKFMQDSFFGTDLLIKAAKEQTKVEDRTHIMQDSFFGPMSDTKQEIEPKERAEAGI